MATLSPFRYIQLCRYILTRVLYDKHLAPAMSIWKGKAKEAPSAPKVTGASRSSIRTLGFATAMERQSGDDGPVAGPSREPLPPSYHSPRGPLRPDPNLPPEPNEIYRLMNDERLLVGDAQPPREVVVLCHGLYGFSTATPIPLFPSLKLHYWASVLEVLRDRMGANVVVVGVKGTGSVKERAEQMHKYLSDTLPIGTGVNFVAHSMGGLDVRHLISNIKPTRYTPLTLTTIGTPHRGSPFMDWCAANIGLGSASQAAAKAVADATKGLPYSLKSPLLAAEAGDVSGLAGFTNAMTRYLLNIFDSPAYANLTTSFCRDFNPETPDDPRVKYVSVAGRTTKMSVLHPLWFPKLVLDAAAEKGYPRDDSGKGYEGNDGLVSVKSAKWGEFLGAVDDTHHWDLRGEGGLWPTGFGADDSASEKAKKGNGKDAKESDSSSHKSDELIMPGGWDWDDSIHEYLGLDLASAKEKIGLGGSDGKKVAEKAVQQGKEGAAKAANGSSTGSANDGWAATQAANAAQEQVGQLIDWVTDVLPGSQSTEAGKKRIQDAKDENKRVQGGTKKKKDGEKDKFDLARFYGGLMLKLRDEGY